MEYEIKDLKKLSISALELIILNDKNKSNIRKCAEIELKIRIKNLGWMYEDFLHAEDKIFSVRGLDIDNYLIGNKPSMQQLMELYFLYSFDTKYEDNLLLFSERHLCNNMTFCSKFFDNVCSIEIQNMEKRLNSKAEKDDQNLLLFKKALEKRKKDIEENKKKYYSKTELLEFNEALQLLSQDSLLEFGYNLSDEQLYDIACSKIKTFKYIFLESLNDGIFDADLFQNLFGLKKVLIDSSKLKLQKRLLLSEVKNGALVDYSSKTMRKVLEKVETSVNYKNICN